MIKKIWNRLSVTAQLSVALVCFIAGIILAIEANTYLYQKPLTEKRFERLMEINDIQQEDFISYKLTKPYTSPGWNIIVVYKSRPEQEYIDTYDWALTVDNTNCWPWWLSVNNSDNTWTYGRHDMISAFEKGENLIFPEN